ncbi:hypothetical protein D3C73_1641410 [compost metagenome]
MTVGSVAAVPQPASKAVAISERASFFMGKPPITRPPFLVDAGKGKFLVFHIRKS